MNLLKIKQHISIRLLILFFVIIFFVILYFGLRPKNYLGSNNTTWLSAKPGIHFGLYSVAYTHQPFISFYESNILSVEMALKPEIGQHNKGFKLLFVLHNGEDSSQLLIGQYGTWIIAMNGDDYDNTKKAPRISVKDALLHDKTRHLTITSGKEGTKIYLDGKLSKTKNDLLLKVPEGKNKTRLIVANSVYGQQSWTGEIYGLAIYRYPLSEQDVAFHYKQWIKENNFEFAIKADPEVLYLFDEKAGEIVLDKSGGNLHLEVPLKMQLLKKKILAIPVYNSKLKRLYVIDIILNFIGFIPMGFILNALFLRLGRADYRYAGLIVIIICFSISLAIEITQAWIPSRSSSLLDLILNTFGASIGVILGSIILHCNNAKSEKTKI